MNIDYERLRELSDKASPRPWTVKDDDCGEVIVANESGHTMTWGEQVRFEMYAGDKNVDPHLVALAPDMAVKLVQMNDGIARIHSELNTLAGMLAADGYHAQAKHVSECADALNELLNGDDE